MSRHLSDFALHYANPFIMCIKYATVCCHCGDLMEPLWTSCNHHVVLSQAALGRASSQSLPQPQECPYLRRLVRPLLGGCANNDSCPSWLWTVSEGTEYSKQEATEEEHELARAKYDEYQEEFATKYFARRPLRIHRERGILGPALEEDSEIDFSDSEDDTSLTDEDEGDWSESETSSLDDRPGCTTSRSAPPGLNVTIEWNPELLIKDNFPTKRVDLSTKKGNLTAKEESLGLESEARESFTLARQYQDLIDPLWAWFF